MSVIYILLLVTYLKYLKTYLKFTKFLNNLQLSQFSDVKIKNKL